MKLVNDRDVLIMTKTFNKHYVHIIFRVIHENIKKTVKHMHLSE